MPRPEQNKGPTRDRPSVARKRGPLHTERVTNSTGSQGATGSDIVLPAKGTDPALVGCSDSIFRYGFLLPFNVGFTGVEQVSRRANPVDGRGV